MGVEARAAGDEINASQVSMNRVERAKKSPHIKIATLFVAKTITRHKIVLSTLSQLPDQSRHLGFTKGTVSQVVIA